MKERFDLFSSMDHIEPCMNHEERLAIAELLESLLVRYEDQYEQLSKQMEEEHVNHDFYEDLYEILYEFAYDEMTLLARVLKLLEEKSRAFCDKKTQKRYN
ncbi:MAG: hypothetical protein HFE68_01255 [Erysipelotrichaceae bacterium]|nr:hypothetical protein [Erysipelotrichaceae bacterium]MCI9311972.1 hypothetical protein [Erysipelotrichaceae bacterium]